MSANQLNSLRTFNAQARVQKATMALKAHQVSPETLKELRSVFKKTADAAGDVEMATIRDKIRQMPSMESSRDEVMRCLWKLEKGTGKVKFNQFIDAMIKRHKQLQNDAMKAVFEAFDFDGGGSISLPEIDAGCDLSYENSSWKEALELIFGVDLEKVRNVLIPPDRDLDYEMEFEEFCRVVEICGEDLAA